MSFKIIVIGVSKGGLQALQTVLSALTAEFPLPVVIVAHRERNSDDEFKQLLQQVSCLSVVEVEDKQPILPGFVFLAPAGYHLLIEAPSSLHPPYFALSTTEPVRYARPSIDVLFESAAEVYDNGVIGVILTGTMKDGASGLAAIKKAGGLAIVQDPTTAMASSMPEAAIAATKVDKILPLEEIGPFLNDFLTPRRENENNSISI
ncbi:MAG: chemotaxis protein CheB [bacterium]|nr:chemotaxis protein CheB [bacterium]